MISQMHAVTRTRTCVLLLVPLLVVSQLDLLVLPLRVPTMGTRSPHMLVISRLAVPKQPLVLEDTVPMPLVEMQLGRLQHVLLDMALPWQAGVPWEYLHTVALRTPLLHKPTVTLELPQLQLVAHMVARVPLELDIID